MNKERILSIDIFRGLTIFLMVFVNELAGVAHIPQWMKHMPADMDGMTIVDVVFPAFLFIVGMAIPFAVENRLKKVKSLTAFWQHVGIRTLGLLVLGVYMVNSGEMNSEASLIPKSYWAASLYIAAILIWNQYPKSTHKSKRILFVTLRVLGVLTLIVLYFLYRKGSPGELQGMTASWWGILGLIGWAYFLSVILFMAAQKQLTLVLTSWTMLLIAILFLRNGSEVPPDYLIWIKAQSGHLVHTLIALSGVICSLLLSQGEVNRKALVKMGRLAVMGGILWILGYFVQPFGGISKIAATPSWALFSASICCFAFPLIYWLVDIKEIKSWANFLRPAGVNPLLTYILPPLFYALFGYSYVPDFLGSGILGILRALLFSLFILWIAERLTKYKIRLQL